MKIAYILPVNMRGYGYTKENFIKTHFSVDIAREMARKNIICLHVFWDHKDMYQEKNLTIYFYPLSLKKIFNSSFAEISFELLKKSFPPDTIIHFHEPNRLFYFFFCLLKKNPIIVEHHGSGITNPFPFPSRFSILLEIIKRFFLPLYLARVQYIIVHNTLAKNNFISHHVDPKKIIIAPNGIQPERYTIIDKQQAKKSLHLTDKIILLFAGRIHKGKGIIELINAYKNIQKTSPNLELILLGPLHDNSLESLVKPYWKGFKNPQELQICLSAADIFCLPSYEEPFGIVLLEALYYDLPIITTNIAGPKEFVPRENALFIPPKDTIRLQEAIEKMLDAIFRESKSKNGRELVLKRYTWQQVCKTYLELYTKR